MKTPRWKSIFMGLGLMSVALVFVFSPWKRLDHMVLQWDVSLYYTYLPAVFIYQDVGVKKQWPVELKKHHIGFYPGKDGKQLLKMTSGMAYVYLPAFAAGHLWASLNSNYAADGYSLPYQVSIAVWVGIYIIIGLWFLFLFVRRYVDDAFAFTAILIIFFGTNMLYFTYWDGAITHAATFTLLSIFLELGERYINRKKIGIAILIGLLAGWMVLIRPVNALPLLIIALWWMYRIIQNKDVNILHACASIVAATLSIIPQLLYWHYITGSFFSYSYGEEGFFWADPQIINGLFSWRKGWFIYTPVMLFAVLGFIPLYKKNKILFALVSTVFCTYIYVVFSWWCWWYGGGYGQRALIDIYPLLALPLAFFLQWMMHLNLWKKFIFFNVIVALVMYNFFTTYQAITTILHWDSMTKESYRAIFMRTKFPDNIQELNKTPDYNAAMKGDRD